MARGNRQSLDRPPKAKRRANGSAASVTNKPAPDRKSSSVKKYVQKLQGPLLQPSNKHYGGGGYAKDSVFLSLTDPTFQTAFNGLWDEHIPGFTGKSLRKQKSGAQRSMEWRRRLEQKAMKRSGKVGAADTDGEARSSQAGAGDIESARSQQANLQAAAIAAYKALKARKKHRAGV